MSLLEYLRVLIQRGWILLLCGLLAAAAMFVYSSRQPVIYRATQLMIVQPQRADLGMSQANRALINGYVVYLNSSRVAQDVAQVLGMDVSGAELKGRAEIGALPDRAIIEINVNDTDGENANRVAFEWGQQLIRYRQQLNEGLPADDHVNVSAQDFPTYVQYRPRTAVNMVLGGLVGLLLGGVMAFVLEYRRSRVIRLREDLESVLGDAPLGVIPAAPR